LELLNILSVIHWDVNPHILKIGGFEIRWYGLLFALAFYLGYLIMTRIFRNEKLNVELVDKVTLYMVIGTVVGARLGHVLFYEPAYYFAEPIRILQIWQGGLASHGAAIGILLALLIFSIREKLPFLWIVDRIVITVALAGFFIRSGNLMNSEIVGKQASVPWAFVFERLRDSVPRHPVQIYEALAYLAIFVFLVYLYRKYDGLFRYGFLFSVFLMTIFTARFLLEFFKANQVPIEQELALNMGHYLSIPFILAGLIMFFFVKRKGLSLKV